MAQPVYQQEEIAGMRDYNRETEVFSSNGEGSEHGGQGFTYSHTQLKEKLEQEQQSILNDYYNSLTEQ